MRNIVPIGSILFTGLMLLSVERAGAHTASEDMAQAASTFLTALTPEQKGKASFEFKADERQNWHFIPKPRLGLPLKEMTHDQRPLAHALLASGLSHRGLIKAETIMSMEGILRQLEGTGGKMVRDSELYYVSIFGAPATNSTWGWRVEGHHLSVNFTLVNGKEISATPSFLGSNPAEVRTGPRKGLRILGEEEELGRQLLKMLSEDKRKLAIIPGDAPKEVITGAERKVMALKPAGIPAGQMSGDERKVLETLIKEYIYRERSELADNDWKKIERAGLDKVMFAWAGGVEMGEGNYYRVQGPTFLLEYDNTQNNNNHVHAVWRDFEHDFGVDLLREHYDRNAH